MFKIGQQVTALYADGTLFGEIRSRVGSWYIVEITRGSVSGIFVSRKEYELKAA